MESASDYFQSPPRHETHAQRPAHPGNGFEAGLCIGSERLVQSLAGQAGRLGDFAQADGSIRLRPAVVYPIEHYSDERIEEFERENQVPAATRYSRLIFVRYFCAISSKLSI